MIINVTPRRSNSKYNVRAGDRIVLLKMEDDPDPIPPGTYGWVVSVTRHIPSKEILSIGVRWDNGRTLGLLIDEDEFIIV